MDRRMNPSCQVRLSFIFKLGHTRRNQRLIVTTETDRRRWIVASLMRRTRRDLAGGFKKFQHLISPHFFTLPPISLPFKLPKSLPLPTDHCSPKTLQSPKSYHLLVGVAAVGVFSVTKYFSILFFSNSQVCVSNFYSFILHFCLSISFSLILIDMFISFI